MHSRTANPARHHAAMSLIDLIATLVVLVGLLGALTLINRTLRHEAADQRTRQTMLALQAALRTYAADHGTAPTGDVGDALLALQAHPSADKHLAGLRLVQSAARPPQVLDGFGRPLQYQGPDHHRRLPASFVSAGRSGDFGSAHPSSPRQRDLSRDTSPHNGAPEAGPPRRAAADNLYGFELETFTP